MIDFLAAAIRIATPPLACGAWRHPFERAGVFAVGLEGMMLMGAFQPSSERGRAAVHLSGSALRLPAAARSEWSLQS